MAEPMDVNAANVAPMDIEMCDSCECIINERKIRQMDTGMCWFVALIHVISLSDGFKKYKKNTSKNIQEATELLTSISGQSCVPQNKTQRSLQSIIFGIQEYCNNLKSFGADTDGKYILYEYFSPLNDLNFCPATPYSGGVSFYYITPFLIYQGIENHLTAKHVICDFGYIKRLYKDINYNPRQIKYTRVYSDYMKWILSGQPRGYIEDTNIFIVTFIQGQDNIEDIQNRRLFLGKYLMFIYESKIYVYKLDAMLMSSLNNNNRKPATGHMIACITCKDAGYIINSYDSQGNDYVNCGHLQYDWHKWKNKDEFFSHKIHDTTCSTGKILPLNNTMYNTSVVTNQDDFYYHRDIGDNSFFYVKIYELSVSPNSYIIPEYQDIFDDYIYPYFYYFKFYTGLDITFAGNINEIIQSLTMPVYNYNIHQTGIGIENVNIYNWGCFYLALNLTMEKENENIINSLVDILPDDMIVISRVIEEVMYVYIFVQYNTRQEGKLVRYHSDGGRKTKPKTPKQR